MILHPWRPTVLVGLLILLTAASGPTRARSGVSGSRPGYPFASWLSRGYGSNPYTGFGSSECLGPLRLWLRRRNRPGGAGYRRPVVSTGRPTGCRPQTTVALQPSQRDLLGPWLERPEVSRVAESVAPGRAH